MTAPAGRFVVLADPHPAGCRLTVAPNGSGRTATDVAALATAAALIPRVSPRAVWIRTSELPDFEALCSVRNVTVVRRRGAR